MKIKAQIDEKNLCSDWIYEEFTEDTAIDYGHNQMIAVIDDIPCLLHYYDNILVIKRADAESYSLNRLQSIVEEKLGVIFSNYKEYTYTITQVNNKDIYVYFYMYI